MLKKENKWNVSCSIYMAKIFSVIACVTHAGYTQAGYSACLSLLSSRVEKDNHIVILSPQASMFTFLQK